MLTIDGVPVPLLGSLLMPRRSYGPGRKNPHKNITLTSYREAHRDDREPEGISRQTRRALIREGLKEDMHNERAREKRRRAAKARERQRRRELSGFYDGKGVTLVTALAHKRAGRLHRRVLKDDTGKAKADNLVRLG